MMDWFITFIAKALFEKRMRRDAAADVALNEREAGTGSAARYTRGNVAIQQGRINDKPLYS